MLPGFDRSEGNTVYSSLTAWAIELIGLTIVLSFVAGPPVRADDSWLNVVLGLGMVAFLTTPIIALVSEIAGKVLDWRNSEPVRLFTR